MPTTTSGTPTQAARRVREHGPATPGLASRKAHGIHYTPPLLAAYLAEQVVHGLLHGCDESRRICILDPACGEGELLTAIVDAAPRNWRGRLSLTGFDRDEEALKRASEELTLLGVASVSLHCADFLSIVSASDLAAQLDLLPVSRAEQMPRFSASFDAVISNPPYVRTQVLGSAAARDLAARFELTGRVDLYHAFVKAMTIALRDGGILGLLTSNRFLTVQSGCSMRDWLLEHFRISRVVDLGDTKLFEAAVLPAVVIAERNGGEHKQDCKFIRVYEAPHATNQTQREARSVLDVLDGSFAGSVRVNGLCFRVETGRLQTGGDSKTPWTMSNSGVASWLATVTAHSSGTFADVAKICVGIKTTADSVFVRDDWDLLSDNERPEAELLNPLVTHHLANRWHLPASGPYSKRVLYPYSMTAEERVPVDLADFPRARTYLLKHRARLEGRNYVVESGRRWYEVWVPHHPRDWSQPKLAFPDISETSRFFLVEPGWIVNGDCYWAKLLPGKDARWLMLMLAVANSSFVLKFYDAVFHNKLYSGRRRFMSQYVSRFPLPTLNRAKEILNLMPAVLLASTARKGSELEQLEEELDGLVWKVFGLTKEVAR